MRWWVGAGCGANPPHLLKAWFDLMGKILGLFSFARRVLLIALLACAAVFGSVGIASADTAPAGGSVNAVVKLDDTTAGAVADSINDGTGKEFLSYDDSKGVLTFDNNAYSRLTQDARKEYMKTALKGVKRSTLQDMTKNRMFEFISDQDSSTTKAIKTVVSDTNADILAGSEFWRLALPFLSAALGIIIWGLFLFLIFRLVIDMTFLINNGGFLEPLFIKWYDNDSRNGVITRVQQDGVRTRFISGDAYRAYSDYRAGKSGYPLFNYFLKSIINWILAGLIILLLMTGQFLGLAGWLFDTIEPIWEIITHQRF